MNSPEAEQRRESLWNTQQQRCKGASGRAAEERLTKEATGWGLLLKRESEEVWARMEFSLCSNCARLYVGQWLVRAYGYSEVAHLMGLSVFSQVVSVDPLDSPLLQPVAPKQPLQITYNC